MQKQTRGGGNMQALKGQRISNGCTQDDASKLLGISRLSYSKKENRKVPFTISEVDILRKAWNMTDADVIRVFFT